ncbi:MAG: hypothetical protein ABJM29_15800 [Rhizobiaceae bacterium]
MALGKTLDLAKEEIEQLDSRVDPTLFTPGLVELEQQLREVRQDPLLERVQAAFEKTPLFTNRGFVAADYDIAGTQVDYSVSRPMIVAAFAFLGLIAGLLVLTVRNALKARGITA